MPKNIIKREGIDLEVVEFPYIKDMNHRYAYSYYFNGCCSNNLEQSIEQYIHYEG